MFCELGKMHEFVAKYFENLSQIEKIQMLAKDAEEMFRNSLFSYQIGAENCEKEGKLQKYSKVTHFENNAKDVKKGLRNIECEFWKCADCSCKLQDA